MGLKKAFDSMGIYFEHQSGCSSRTVGHITNKQLTNRIIERHEQCRVADAEAKLGCRRVFSPLKCPDVLKGLTLPEERGNLETRMIPISMGRVEMLQQPGYEHEYLFCVPRLSIGQLISAFPDLFDDISGLSDKVMDLVTSARKRDWRWFSVSRLLVPSPTSEELTFPEVAYIQLLVRNAMGNDFFQGRVVCKNGLNQGAMLSVGKDGRLSFPKWNGFGVNSHAWGTQLVG